MGISGTWYQRSVRDYTGAARWGTGYNPIHGVLDNGRGRQIGTRENLLPLGQPSDAVSPGLTARDIDFVCEDYVDSAYPGEFFRYQAERPRWDALTTQFRNDTNGPAMGEQPSWGPHFNSDPTGVWPLPGPTSGMQEWLDVDHGEVEEQQHAVAVPTQPVTGGWLNKARGGNAQPESQEANTPGLVWTINNATVQGPGLKELANERAVARGTDSPRASITSRTAGMVEKTYARSLRMGGGPGSPDMTPFQQTAGLKRPFQLRQAATPPPGTYTWNTMEGRFPIQRAVPSDPYQGDPEAGASANYATSDWGY